MASKNKYEDGCKVTRIMTLPQYIRSKVKVLHQLGYDGVTKENFVGCKSELSVDCRARTIIFSE